MSAMKSAAESTAAALPELKTSMERIGGALSESWDHLRIATDAQINIWSMKVSRAVFMAILAVPALGVFLALMIYGFILLNQAFALALEAADMPPWYSPLVRGAIYFGVPAVGLAIVWWNSAGGTAHKHASGR
jgi:hypothetical protein